MSYAFILPAYFAWHYGEALKDLFSIWTNFIWFFYNFFSIPVLLKTLFDPWQRIIERRSTKAFDFGDLASVLLTNLIMRLVGLIVRLLFVVTGTAVIVAVFWLGILAYVFWLALPVLAVLSFAYGFSRII